MKKKTFYFIVKQIYDNDPYWADNVICRLSFLNGNYINTINKIRL